MFGKVNIGILGTGTIAGVMADTIRRTRHARLYAVASRDADRAQAFGTRYGAKRAYGSYEDLVKDRKVDLVYVATPNSEHYANANLCLDHGKACLVEKPFTVNAAQAQALIRKAEDKGIFLAEAMWTRFLPFGQKIREVLESGLIGDPVMLTAGFGFNLQEVQRLQEPALGGGALLDLGVYPLNLAAMLFGNDVLRINATCTYTERHLDSQDSIALVYRDGKLANLSASMLGAMDQQGVVIGTQGCMVIGNINNFEDLTVYDAKHRKVAYYKRPRQKTGYEYELRACIRAVKAKQTEVAEMPHAETMSIMHMLDFIRQELEVSFPFEQDSLLGKVSDDTAVTAQVSDRLEEATKDSVQESEAQTQSAALFRKDTEDAPAEPAGTERENGQVEPVQPEQEEEKPTITVNE